jgi:hypothetical protein
MHEEPAGTIVSIAISGVVQVRPEDIPIPTCGPEIVAERLQEYFTGKGVKLSVHEIASITVAQRTKYDPESLTPFIKQILDRHGALLTDRRYNVLEHAETEISHRYELQLWEAHAPSSQWIWGYVASVRQAVTIGQLWKEGRLDIYLERLPPAETQVD